MKKLLFILSIFVCVISYGQNPIQQFAQLNQTTSSPPPSSPVAGYFAWYKADAGVSTTGSEVTAWADQSGGGYNFTSIANPDLITGAINGYPAIRFNGTSDAMLASGLGVTTSTLFFVLKPISVTSFGEVISAKTTFVLELRWNNTAQKLQIIVNGTTISDANNITLAYHVIALTAETTSTIHIDGTQVATGSATPGTASAGLSIGARLNGSNVASLFGNYEFAEIIVYNTALSGTNRALNESYLKNKYGL